MKNSNQTIMRTVKTKDNPYVMIDKYGINDERLSWKAKGLLVYFLSKPDNWTIMIEDVIKHGKDGRDAVRAGIRELEEYGYVVRFQLRGERGKFGQRELHVFERPQTPDIEEISPITENPSTVENTADGKPGDGKSANGKSHTTNNDLNNNDLSNKRIKKYDDDRVTDISVVFEKIAKEKELPEKRKAEVLKRILQNKSGIVNVADYVTSAIENELNRIKSKPRNTPGRTENRQHSPKQVEAIPELITKQIERQKEIEKPNKPEQSYEEKKRIMEERLKQWGMSK
jgi:hypothetical protein